MRLNWERIKTGCYRAHLPGGATIEARQRFASEWQLWSFANADTPYGDKIARYSTLGALKADAAVRAEELLRTDLAGDGPSGSDIHAQRQR